jgi:hypothetical protein
MVNNGRTEGANEMTMIPCGWCDAPVEVEDDHGQVVYCSDVHARWACRGVPRVTTIPVVERIPLCAKCGHQRASHSDGRYNADDGRWHPGPCKDCRCRRYGG